MFNDGVGKLFLTPFANRVFIDAENLAGSKLSDIKRYKEILSTLEVGLREKGVTELFCIVSSVRNFRFAELFGFKTNLEVINNVLEVMRKDILSTESF